MSQHQKIQSGDIYVREWGTVVSTRCQKEKVTDKMLLDAATYARLKVGDQVLLQCMNHEQDAVLWQRRFIVAGRRDYLKRSENFQGDVKHEETFEVRVEPETDWWEVTPSGVDERKVTTAWNVGKRVYEIKVDGEIRATHEDKQTAALIAEELRTGETDAAAAE